MSRSSRQLLLLILSLIGLGILLAIAPLTKISFWGIDVYTFRSAAKAMMLGADPYHEPNILQFADGVKVGNIHAYLYAPYFAFALRPLAWVSPELASRIWFSLNLLFFFASIGLLLAYLRWLPKGTAFLGLLVGLILFPPLRTTLIIGQSTILLLFFFALSLFLLRQQRPLASGLVFSLGLFKPHLFPFLLFLAFYRQWRWLAGVGLGLILLHLPLAGWLDNWLATATATREANLALDQCFQMVSLVSLLSCTLFWPSWLTLVVASSLSAVLLGLIWWSTQVDQPSLKDEALIFDRRLAVFTVLSALLIDHTRIADQMLLLFPLLVAWRDWQWLGTGLARRVALFLTLLIYVLPYSLDILGPRQIAFLLPFWYIALSGAVLGMLLLEWRGYREQPVFMKPGVNL